MVVIQDRTSDTLEEWIEIFIENDPNEAATVIVTDGWAGYNNIEELGFEHHVHVHG